MKVLHFNDTGYHVGGAETNLFSIMEVFKEKGHEQFLFSLKGCGNPEEDVFIFDRVNGRNTAFFSNLVNPDFFFNKRVYDGFKEHIRRTEPDVIHMHNNFLFMNTVFKAVQESGIPAVLTAHDYGIVCPLAWCMVEGVECEGGFGFKCLSNKCFWLKRYIREYFPRKLAWQYLKKNFKTIICPSKRIEKKLNENGLDNTTHIPYFIFPERFKSSNRDIINGNILFVGVLHAQKGVEYLIKALP